MAYPYWLFFVTPLSEVETAALSDTILAWCRRLVARKFDRSGAHRCTGRPSIDKELEE